MLVFWSEKRESVGYTICDTENIPYVVRVTAYFMEISRHLPAREVGAEKDHENLSG